jgi:large subunit ribosomal protein L23
MAEAKQSQSTAGNGSEPASGRANEKSGPGLAAHQIILRPLVTEKGVHRSTRNNQYAFEVNTLAGKDEIKNAVEEMFEVKVVKVRTQNRKGKPRRHRWKLGYTRSWKKALVTLDSEDRIDFF